MDRISIVVIDPNDLIDNLKAKLSPAIVNDGAETVLSFNNHLGNGTFTIVSTKNDFLNIFFNGIFFKEFSLSLSNPELRIVNYMFIIDGRLNISNNEQTINTKYRLANQLVYKQNLNDTSVIRWSSNEYVSFNLLMVFETVISKSVVVNTQLLDNEEDNFLSPKIEDSNRDQLKSAKYTKESVSIVSSNKPFKEKLTLFRKVKTLLRFKSDKIN